MPTLILNTRDFYMKSSWTGTQAADGIRYTTPTLATAYPSFAASQLPRGAAVTQALLRVRAAMGYTGGVLTVQGNTATEQDVTALVRPDSAGIYPDLTLAFAYRAYGGQGGAGAHLSTAHVTSAVIEVTFTTDSGGDAAQREAVWQACCRPDRRMQPFAVLRTPDGGEQALGPEAILSFRLDEGCGDGPLLGQAPAAALALRLANTAHEWYPGGSMRGSRALLGARIRLRMQVWTAAGPVNVPLGAFTVEEMLGDEQDGWLELRGFDSMATALEAPWTDTTVYPVTLSDLLGRIAAQTGLGVDGVLSCNRAAVIRRAPDWGADCTLRRALMQVCAAGGAFACVTRTGLLGIRPARGSAAEPLTLAPALYMRLRHDERRFDFNRVTARPAGAGDPVSAAVDGALPALPQNTLYLRGNALLAGDSAQAGTLLDGLKTAFTGASWQALRLTWRGDPQRTIGERLLLTDTDGHTLRSLVCADTLVWDRGFRMEAVCRVQFSLLTSAENDV